MKTVIFCEGTTDLLMIQFLLQYKYGWKYKGFIENAVTNRLLKRQLEKDGGYIEIRSCGGISNIPHEMKKFQEQIEFSTKTTELFDKVIVMIDHDTIDSNLVFISRINKILNTNFEEKDINNYTKWNINTILGDKELGLHIHSIPENQTGAIENIMLEALATDNIEMNLIEDSKKFISQMSEKQNRYLTKKSLHSKAVFNTYFAIRTPEEKYDERARILKSYDWEKNEILNSKFEFLNLH